MVGLASPTVHLRGSHGPAVRTRCRTSRQRPPPARELQGTRVSRRVGDRGEDLRLGPRTMPWEVLAGLSILIFILVRAGRNPQ